MVASPLEDAPAAGFDEADRRHMERALAQARRAARLGEVPVGAVLADPAGRLLAAAHNRSVSDADPTAHAEMLALRAGAAAMGNYRLTGCVLYVTLEPCAMCAGASIWARVARIVYGAADPKAGALGSVVNLADQPSFNHRPAVAGGLLADQAAALLTEFFRERRAK